jgi:hypothetical protein
MGSNHRRRPELATAKLTCSSSFLWQIFVPKAKSGIPMFFDSTPYRHNPFYFLPTDNIFAIANFGTAGRRVNLYFP